MCPVAGPWVVFSYAMSVEVAGKPLCAHRLGVCVCVCVCVCIYLCFLSLVLLYIKNKKTKVPF